MTEPILRVSNIETYYGPIMAIRGISLHIDPGKIVTVRGANGAGKTTLLKTISGAMDPQKGTVEFEGREIQKQDPDRVMRAGISHVPEGREVFPFLTVHENLMMGAFTRRDREGIQRDLELVLGYFPVLEAHGFQEIGQRLHEMSLKGEWAEMGELVPDEMLEAFCVSGEYDEIAGKFVERYGGLLDEVCFTVFSERPPEEGQMRKMVRRLQEL